MRPTNKRERQLIGKKKSKKRTKNLFKDYEIADQINEERRHRNTTNTCSCMMCGNPRKHFNEITIQEKRFYNE